MTHLAHHRGQITVYLRLWGQALYLTYGPTADTGGLFQNQADVIYRYASVDDLIVREREAGRCPPYPAQGRRVRRRDRIKVESLKCEVRRK